LVEAIESNVSENVTNLSEFIREAFGSNATYVEGLFARYKTDPKSVDESWQTYFSDLLNGGAPAETSATQKPETPAPASTTQAENRKSAAVPLSAGTTAKPLTGAAKKIVENMEQSLTVPTATSSRTIPVKVLEENRRILNEHLAALGHGKISFTHIIAWAIIQSVKTYPHLNFGYGVAQGAPSRLEHEDINLGIAIDIEKKDGSRNLLVPNIKAAGEMSFAEFFVAYNEQVKKAREGKLEIADFQGTTISLTNPGTIGTARQFYAKKLIFPRSLLTARTHAGTFVFDDLKASVLANRTLVHNVIFTRFGGRGYFRDSDEVRLFCIFSGHCQLSVLDYSTRIE
jgi:2-oxoglutarate dehydrogenase E1 component